MQATAGPEVEVFEPWRLSYLRRLAAEETQKDFDKALKQRERHEAVFAAIGGPKLKDKRLTRLVFRQELLDMVAMKGHMDGWGTRSLSLKAARWLVGFDTSSGRMAGRAGRLPLFTAV